MISGATGCNALQEQNIQCTSETDSITQGLASLEKRLSVELKVCMLVTYIRYFRLCCYILSIAAHCPCISHVPVFFFMLVIIK